MKRARASFRYQSSFCLRQIGNGTLSLLRHPEQHERLQAEPALIKTAVEELLRYEGPLETTTERFAGEDIELGGALIPQGASVRVVLASANRDEAQFDQPDRLDITRTPNRHLAFGRIHYCLGAPLARLEGQIAVNTLLRRMPDLRLAVPPDAVSWRSGLLMHGLETLPLTFSPSAAGLRHRTIRLMQRIKRGGLEGQPAPPRKSPFHPLVGFGIRSKIKKEEGRSRAPPFLPAL